MLSKIKPLLNKYFQGVFKLLASLGITPNMLTFTSLAVSLLLLSLVFVKRENTPPLLVIALIFIVNLLDFLDGGLARYVGQSSSVGAFLDSTFDRVADAIVLVSLAYCGFISFEEAYISLVGFYLVSYSRARAEGLKRDIKLAGVGLMERAERILVLLLSYILYVINLKFISKAVFYTLIVLVYMTVLERILVIVKRLRKT